MKILLTGATGYIGKRLLPVLVSQGHHVICCVRDKNRFNPPASLQKSIEIIQVDFLDEDSLRLIPEDIDGAFYLMHSMSSSAHYDQLEKASAQNFKNALNRTRARHVVYLSGIVNDDSLSKHLSSRKAVEEVLGTGNYALTTLRAGIIIGSGSASFEIIRDLVEKLPIMVVPKWLRTKCQPIAVGDVISFLSKTLLNELTYNTSYDIGGPEVISYKEMLLGYARVRKLWRKIYIVPVMTPRLSSYWLYFVTSTSYKLATALVSSMKVEVICRESNLNNILQITPINYTEALQKTLEHIEGNQVVSSWKDSLISGRFEANISEFLTVPSFGCLIDKRIRKVADPSKTVEKIWRIGGTTGWYYANWLWKIRGVMDKMVGGVGLRRGRTQVDQLAAGSSVDFWRVLYANKEEGRLLLFAEMKLPGEAWLEFVVKDNTLTQSATFRPKGLWGRLYWYLVFPLHGIVFGGMIKSLSE